MIVHRKVIRWAGAVVAAGSLVAATACTAPEPLQPVSRPALLAWLLEQPRPGECAADDDVHKAVDGLISSGLADAGYRNVLVVCDEPRPPTSDDDRDALEEAGVAVEVIASGDKRASDPISAASPAPSLQRALTRAAIAAESVVVEGSEPARLDPQQVAVLTNRGVLDVVRDDRRVPGAPVAESDDVRARAIGEKGIVVALSNPDDHPRRVTVAIADLNLAGDDEVPATDLWTGDRQVAVDGQLGVDLPAHGTALLAIGR